MRYDDALIEQIQSSNDIVEVISSYIPLRRSGRSFKAVCPFHQEKTPSFYVHPERQIFHCFGCGAGGDVYSFLMRVQNISFPEAVKELAERSHITLPEREWGGGETGSQTRELLDIYREGHDYYRSNFLDPSIGREARQYVVSRRFDLEAVSEFGLGFARSEWRGLYETLRRKGFSDDLILRSGLVLRSSQGSPYDFFRNRLIFPIANALGKVVAFGGRVFSEELPKYINSPETEIFKKRRELYGLHIAKRHISEERPEILIVEGYFDVIRLHTAGFRNVVATLGTALTEDHVRNLRRYAEQAVLVYDGDKAGESASLRSFEVFLEGNLSVKILALPTRQDPDLFILEEGGEGFAKLLQQSEDFFDFKLKILLKRYDPRDTLGYLKIMREFVATFAKIGDRILLDRYVRRLSEKIGVSEDSIRAEVAKLSKKLGGAQLAGESMKQTEGRHRQESEGVWAQTGLDRTELMFFSLISCNRSFLRRALEEFEADDFQSPLARNLFQESKARFERDDDPPDLKVFLNRFEDEFTKSAWAEVSFVDLSEEESEKAFSDCTARIKRKRLQEKLRNLQMQMSQSEASKDADRTRSHMKEYQEILAHMKKLVSG